MNEDYDTKDDGVKLHLRESEALKKQWVTYVFETVQKLHDRVEANTLQVQKEREEFFHKLVELKEKLEEQLKDASKEQARELKKIDEKLTSFIKEVAERFTDVNECVDDCLTEQSDKNDDVSKELKDYIDEELSKIIEKASGDAAKHEEEVKELKTMINTLVVSQEAIKTKLGVYVALITLGTTTILGVLATTLVVFFKESLRAWLG